jgi:hypothetical protein
MQCLDLQCRIQGIGPQLHLAQGQRKQGLDRQLGIGDRSQELGSDIWWCSGFQIELLFERRQAP